MISKNHKTSIVPYLFILPSLLLVISFIGYPMINNILISFQKVPLNPRLPSLFIGLDNYKSVFSDFEFYNSLGLSFVFTFFVVVLSTTLGLAVAIFFNQPFRFKKIIMALILLPYIVPSLSLVFVWRYMFNQIYGIVNYILVDCLKLFSSAPLWFDDPVSSFIMVVLFCVWRFFPYAYLSFYAILQTIDKSYYEAARIDGASAWQQFCSITMPSIMPVLITVITLRTIWMFGIFTEVYLLAKQIKVLGIYLYNNAFVSNDLGKAASISIILFLIIFIFIRLFNKSEQKKAKESSYAN